MKGNTLLALLALLCGFSLVSVRADEVTVSNKVLFVDENGQTNAPEVLADVAAQARNEVAITIAAEKAEAAAIAANEATNIVATVAANIVANEVRIFRKGSLSSFSPLVVFDEEHDKFIISSFDKGATQITFGYVCTVDIGSIKPAVRASNTLASPTKDWEPLPEATVSAPTIHNETVELDGVTFNKWYSITIPTPTDGQYFYLIEMNPDAPDGDGLTLNIVGGITGGVTGVFEIGSKTYTFKGGLLMGVE